MSLLSKLSSRLGYFRAQSCPTHVHARSSSEESSSPSPSAAKPIAADPEKILMRSQSAGEAPVLITVNRPEQGPIASRARARAAIECEERSKGASPPTKTDRAFNCEHQAPLEAENEAPKMEAIDRGPFRPRRRLPKNGSGDSNQAIPLPRRRHKVLSAIQARMHKPSRRSSLPMSQNVECNPTVAMVEEDWNALASAPPLVIPALTRRPEEYVPAFGGANPPWMRARLAESALAAC